MFIRSCFLPVYIRVKWFLQTITLTLVIAKGTKLKNFTLKCCFLTGRRAPEYWCIRPVTGDPGNVPRGPRGRQTLAGKRGEERGTEDRERGVGGKIFPDQLITEGRGEEPEYSRTSYLPPPPFLPTFPPPLVRARGEEGGGSASMLTHGPEERRGGAASQPGHLNERWGERVEGEGWPAR